MKRIPMLAVLAAASAALLAAEVPATLDGAPNYRVIRPGLATAGQPSPEALARLRELGFKTVINLRTEAEGARDEEKVVVGQGLRYVWVPVTPDTFTLEQATRVQAVLEDESAAPVLVHCSSANRVGAVWTVIEVRRGRPFEEAEKEGMEIGLQSAGMREAVRRVLAAAPPPSR
jgi:uncharacterized protein (TIGR01244 family)